MAPLPLARKAAQADGVLPADRRAHALRTGRGAAPALCTLALLSSTTDDPAGSEGSDADGPQASLPLPYDRTAGP
ncbi:hypothetical protein [Streptomyces sp. bgisy092]|uniref:hypothetical protein n=1 Tax=unclassified Streptomyces TaxID=2593676 RepID=UPI003EC0AAA6